MVILNKKNHRSSGFTLVEIATILGIIGFVLAIGVPALIRNRELAQKQACIENLKQIDGAKERYAASEGLTNGDGVPAIIIGSEYIRSMPECPSGGSYTFNRIGEDPICSFDDHRL